VFQLSPSNQAINKEDGIQGRAQETAANAETVISITALF
jgi:hypothetical protein